MSLGTIHSRHLYGGQTALDRSNRLADRNDANKMSCDMEWALAGVKPAARVLADMEVYSVEPADFSGWNRRAERTAAPDAE